jgi:hypothetical protein
MARFITAALGIALGTGIAVVALAAGETPTKTVTGTLEDSYCYGLMGAQGASHKKCATVCAKKGTGKVWVVLPAKNASPYSDDVISKMEDEVTITGKVANKGGVDFITAESVK